MNEGEHKGKKIYTQGEPVTFRLLKRLKYDKDAVLELINEANKENRLNHEIIHALDLYVKYKKYIEKFTQLDISQIEKDFFNTSVDSSADNSIQEKSIKISSEEEREIFSESVEEVVSIEDSSNEKKVIKVEQWAQDSDVEKEEYSPADELFAQDDKKDTKNRLSKAFSSVRRR